jgi:hypothetical protein
MRLSVRRHHYGLGEVACQRDRWVGFGKACPKNRRKGGVAGPTLSGAALETSGTRRPAGGIGHSGFRAGGPFGPEPFRDSDQ